MKNIEDINKALVSEIIASKKITEFKPGDTVKVGVKITEGKRERVQFFEGVCIAKKNRDINTFALYSPIVDSIKVIRSGKVRRAKLYYLRDRKGKSARIAEKIKKKIGIEIAAKPQDTKKENLETKDEETKTEKDTVLSKKEAENKETK